MLPVDVKEFIERYIDKITESEFETVYNKALHASLGIYNVGQLTEVLLQAGIDPLQSLSEVPALYLDGAEHITSSSLPPNILRIKKAGLAFANIEIIVMPEHCELSEGCFRGSNVKSVKIPSIMNEIPEECFYGCNNLHTVELSDIEQIANEAFAHCTSLQDIVIPDTIEYISSSAFDYCFNVCFIVSADNEYAIHYAQEHNIKLKVVDRV